MGKKLAIALSAIGLFSFVAPSTSEACGYCGGYRSYCGGYTRCGYNRCYRPCGNYYTSCNRGCYAPTYYTGSYYWGGGYGCRTCGSSWGWGWNW